MKKKLSILLFCLIACCNGQYIFAQTFRERVGPRFNTSDDPANGIYVSPEGNDAANGSINAPYKSINTALAAAQPGSTIILRSGIYHEGRSVRIRKSNITIKSAKNEWAIIDLTTFNPGNEEDSGVMFNAEDEITRGVVTGCKLQYVEVKGGFYAVCFDSKWDWGQTERNGASDIIIEECILHHSRNDVIKIKPGCDNITIRQNEIHNSGQAYVGHPDTPSGQNNSEGIDNVNGDNMVVLNNYIHDICSNGIYAKGGATDALIKNNIIERTHGAGIAVGFDTSPEYFDLTVNPQYYENIRGVVCNNLIMDTGWEGIGLYASKDAKVYNNTLINVANLGLFDRSAIYFGIVTQDYEPHNGRPANVNPNIHHNLIYQPYVITLPMINIRFHDNDELGKLSGLEGKPTMNNNCYYLAGKIATFSDHRPGSILDNENLAAWKAHIEGDEGSIEVMPSFNGDYMPSNAQCAGIGIQYDLIDYPTGTIAPALLTETAIFANAGVLSINNPLAETIQGYSISGTLLFNFQKQPGNVSYFINQPKDAIIIVRGSTGWTRKIIMQ